MVTRSSTLAWKIPWAEEPGRLQSMESWTVGHNWVTSLALSCIGKGNGNPLQCSGLENPRDGGAWWAAIYGVAQSWTQLKRFSSSSSSVVQLSHPYVTTGRTIGFIIWTFVGKAMFLLFNMLSRFIIIYLPRSKHFQISWLLSPSTVISEPKKIKFVSTSTSPICHKVMGPVAMIIVFWMLSFKSNFFTVVFHFEESRGKPLDHSGMT